MGKHWGHGSAHMYGIDAHGSEADGVVDCVHLRQRADRFVCLVLGLNRQAAPHRKSASNSITRATHSKLALSLKLLRPQAR